MLTLCVLQVSFRTSVQRQSFTVEVCVIDKNDNVPTFIGESMRGSVQLGLLKGTRTLSCDVTAFISLVWVVFVFLAPLYPKIWFMPTCNLKLQFTLYVATLLLLHFKKKIIIIFSMSQGLVVSSTQMQYSKLVSIQLMNAPLSLMHLHCGCRTLNKKYL